MPPHANTHRQGPATHPGTTTRGRRGARHIGGAGGVSARVWGTRGNPRLQDTRVPACTAVSQRAGHRDGERREGEGHTSDGAALGTGDPVCRTQRRGR